jgi:hypothetical protein
VRRGPFRADQARPSGRLLPLHPVPAPDRRGRVSPQAGIDGDTLGRGIGQGLASSRRRLREMPLSRVQGASLSPAIPSRFPACSPIAAQACRCSGPVSRSRSTSCGPSSILRRCCRSGRCRCLPSATGSISSSSSSRVTPASARSRSRASCGSGVVPITLSINAVVDLQLVQAVLDRLSLGQQRALLGCRAALLSPVRQLGRRLVGITCSNAVQGVAGATGLGAVIVGVQPLVAAIK